MRLKDKVAVVTGGAAGLGSAIARTFSREGARVIAVDKSNLDYEDPNVEGFLLNVTDRDDVAVFVETIRESDGRIDVLVNNAGVTRDALTHTMTDEMWDMVIDINLTGVYNMTRLVGPMMMEAGRGSIINISSVVGEFGNAGQSNYAAAKSALYGLSRTWAKEFAGKGIAVRSNCISPGYIMTDTFKDVPDDLLEKFANQTMLGRLGEPREIADVALFLASDESSYVTGHNLSANGGMRL